MCAGVERTWFGGVYNVLEEASAWNGRSQTRQGLRPAEAIGLFAGAMGSN